jgi:flavin reductase (DIM6/NTAB) family NADH-FMN oxidoreductase RutF
MTATAMFVSEKENMLAVSVAQDHLTAQLIKESGRFTLVIASENQEELVWQVGGVKGDAENKFDRFSIKTLPPVPGKPLIPAEAASWLECTVVHQQEVGGYMLVLARVVEQQDLNNPPLVWHRDALFSLKPL